MADLYEGAVEVLLTDAAPEMHEAYVEVLLTGAAPETYEAYVEVLTFASEPQLHEAHVEVLLTDEGMPVPPQASRLSVATPAGWEELTAAGTVPWL